MPTYTTAPSSLPEYSTWQFVQNDHRIIWLSFSQKTLAKKWIGNGWPLWIHLILSSSVVGVGILGPAVLWLHYVIFSVWDFYPGKTDRMSIRNVRSTLLAKMNISASSQEHSRQLKSCSSAKSLSFTHLLTALSRSQSLTSTLCSEKRSVDI